MQQLLASIRERHPNASIERFKVTHPGDDDNLWFVSEGNRELQFECRRDGQSPFLVEGGDDERIDAHSVDEALTAVSRLLAGGA